ncbi:6-carboxytetrahydropterin synthase QueD [Shouchella shacheensis]|uniref:6-carboxytetrahydropterin synthase QueD n=1 Tax=Shouchella shacheensis TaxID=1649580 RepID=UPI0007401231|nr:6-carboxytetrahydropterin synthase QueD [Shouchella shacheensis]
MMQQFYPQVMHAYRFELNKDMQFAAAHYIDDERAGACRRVHGHTYFVNLTIAGDELDDLGFLINFKRLKDTIHKRFDHRLLNDDERFREAEPTTEVVAETIHALVTEELATQPNAPVCLQVIVRETPTSYVTYRPQKDGRR